MEKAAKTTERRVFCILAGVFLGVFMNVLIGISGLMELFPGYTESAGTMFSRPQAMQVIFYVILFPLAEELVFRGFLYRALRRRLRVWPAACISALMFGLYHWNVVQFFYGFVLGVLFAFSAEADHSVLLPILMHMAVNAAVLGLSRLGAFEFLTSGTVPAILALALTGFLSWLMVRLSFGSFFLRKE